MLLNYIQPCGSVSGLSFETISEEGSGIEGWQEIGCGRSPEKLCCRVYKWRDLNETPYYKLVWYSSDRERVRTRYETKWVSTVSKCMKFLEDLNLLKYLPYKLDAWMEEVIERDRRCC